MSATDRQHVHLNEVALTKEGQLVTSGMVGYTMVVIGVGADVESARRAAYTRVRKINVPNMRYRNDIGCRLPRWRGRAPAKARLVRLMVSC